MYGQRFWEKIQKIKVVMLVDLLLSNKEGMVEMQFDIGKTLIAKGAILISSTQ